MSDLYGLLQQLVDAVTELRASHADQEARLERMFRKGKVTDIDAMKQLYRQEIGLDAEGNPVKSPWLPYSQIAGGRKSHSPPSVGEQYLLVSPDGDFTQGLGVPHGWSKDNPSPSQDPNADVDVRGDTKDTTTKDVRKIESKGASIEFTGSDCNLTVQGTLTIKAGSLKFIKGG